MTLHIYTAPMQPATRFRVDLGPPHGGITMRCNPRRLVRCWRCDRLRWAARCEVQVFGDGVRVWCRDRECKRKLRASRRRRGDA